MEILLVRDARNRREEYVERFKLALVTHNPDIAPMLYEEAQQPATEEDAMDTVGKEYRFEPMDADSAERVLAQMLTTTNGTVRMAQDDWDDD